MRLQVWGAVARIECAHDPSSVDDLCHLVLSPDLTPSVARQAARSLCSVDPKLRVVAFGQELARQELPGLVTRVPTFHPSSRAALGSVLRVVRTLR